MKIYLVGFMGSGKSYWGEKLATKLGLPFFDLDETIVQAEQKSVQDIFSESGEEYFRNLERDFLYSISESNEANEVGFVLSCGGGTPCFFNNIEYMKRQGRVVWINPPLHILKERLVREKNKRPLLRDISDEDILLYIQKKLAERKMYYEKADVVINEEEISLAHFDELSTTICN